MNPRPQTQPVEVKSHSLTQTNFYFSSHDIFSKPQLNRHNSIIASCCECLICLDCYSEESDDDDEADTAELCVEVMDKLTPSSHHVSNTHLYTGFV